MVRLTSVTIILAHPPFLFAHPADPTVRNIGGGERGTPVTAKDIAAVEAVINAGNSSVETFDSLRVAVTSNSTGLEPWPLGDIMVTMWMHVIVLNNNPIGGIISQTRLESQLKVLDNCFGETSARTSLRSFYHKISSPKPHHLPVKVLI